MNRSLMDLVESSCGQDHGGKDIAVRVVHALPTSHRQHAGDLVIDKSEASFLVVDNSGSMETYDGKIFARHTEHVAHTEEPELSFNQQERIKKEGYGSKSRWDEAVSKTHEIAEYNLSRGMRCSYYLLNPSQQQHWVEGVDYVVICPATDGIADARKKMQTVLFGSMLKSHNIRGSTPLHKVTRHLRSELHAARSNQSQPQSQPQAPVCYNIVTDGEPNNRRAFEDELRIMAMGAGRDQSSSSASSVFLTINLCTDEDSVVDYYNDLDKKLGSELSGLDVIDDFEAEAIEISNAGNGDFLTYSYDLHVCRMAGCHSVVADLLDEERLSMFHCAKLVRELLFIGRGIHDGVNSSPTLWHDDSDKWLQEVGSRNRLVWDNTRRRFGQLVNVSALRSRIDWWNRARQHVEWWEMNIGPCKTSGNGILWTKPLPRLGLMVLPLVTFLGWCFGGGQCVVYVWCIVLLAMIGLSTTHAVLLRQGR